MLTKKITSLGLTMAMTASLSLLAGCPMPTTMTPEQSASPSVSASVAPSVDPSASVMPSSSASASASVVPSSSASSSATPSASASTSTTSSTTPTETTGVTTDIKEKATFNGTVYDTNDVPVDDVKVTAVSIDPAVSWSGEAQMTAGGAYVFRNAPVGVRILITATKEGWTTRTRTEVLKSNLTGNPEANKFDFMDRDAIQDEPEVVSVKINDKLVTGAGKILSGFELAQISESNQRPASTTTPNLTAIDSSNLKVELTFSEPVDKEDFENGFVINSQWFEREGSSSEFTTDIDSGLNEISFDWASDRKSVTVKTNKPVLANKTGDEARYNLYLANNTLTDDTGKNAFVYNSSNQQGVIRFASKTTSDNVVFSVKNDTDGPMLLGVTAKSGGGANDTVELRFSEPLEVISHTSPLAKLSYESGEFWDSNSSYVTYLNTIYNPGFKTVYALSQVEESTDTPGSFYQYSLNYRMRIRANGDGLLQKVKVEGSKVMMEFLPGSLEVGKKLVVAVGREPKINRAFLNINEAPNYAQFEQLKDPAGNDIEAGNTSTSSKIEVSGVQRVTTIN